MEFSQCSFCICFVQVYPSRAASYWEPGSGHLAGLVCSLRSVICDPKSWYSSSRFQVMFVRWIKGAAWAQVLRFLLLLPSSAPLSWITQKVSETVIHSQNLTLIWFYGKNCWISLLTAWLSSLQVVRTSRASISNREHTWSCRETHPQTQTLVSEYSQSEGSPSKSSSLDIS